MRPVAFGEALPAETRLTLFSNDKPDRYFTLIEFWKDETSGVALALKTGVSFLPSRRRGRQSSFTDSLPIEEEDEDRWCLWRPDQAVNRRQTLFRIGLSRRDIDARLHCNRFTRCVYFWGAHTKRKFKYGKELSPRGLECESTQ
jgi:hypothetical protein